jgi:predicted Ser/Thr protein kinase
MEILAGRYEVLRKLGEGAFGQVYRCRDRELGREVAVKVLRATCRDGDAGRRFRREGALAARVEHPGVVRIFDQGITDEGAPYIVSAYIEGASLAEVLAEGRGPADEAGARAWMLQLAEALDAVHRVGVLHRDLKPDNVFVEDGRLLLGDFGLARGPESQTVLTETGAVIGTPLYLAPEVFLTAETSAAADMWALGAIGYELAYGKLWRGGLSFEQLLAVSCKEQELAPEDPRLGRALGLDPVLLGLLQPDPELRTRSAAEVVASLRGEGAPDREATTKTLAPASPAQPRDWLSPGRVLGLAVAGLAVGWWGSSGTPVAPAEPDRPSLEEQVAEPRAALDRSGAVLVERLPLAGQRQGQEAADRVREILPAFLDPAGPIRWRRYLDDVGSLELARGEHPPPVDWLAKEAARTYDVVRQLRWIEDELEYFLIGNSLGSPKQMQMVADWKRRRLEFVSRGEDALRDLGPPENLSHGYLLHLLEVGRLAPVKVAEDLVEEVLRRLPTAEEPWVLQLTSALGRLLRVPETGDAMGQTWRTRQILHLERANPGLARRLSPQGRASVERDLLWLLVRWIRWDLPGTSPQVLASFDASLDRLWDLRDTAPQEVSVGVDQARNWMERTSLASGTPPLGFQARFDRLLRLQRQP